MQLTLLKLPVLTFPKFPSTCENNRHQKEYGHLALGSQCLLWARYLGYVPLTPRNFSPKEGIPL